jgi:acyl-CoA synthetase (AMP-forming)/AMP-acid ligase II/NAD(P)-dependent dehydrogenase (short-subunit alcohol dehydrogenase family)/acyl carrier protein
MSVLRPYVDLMERALDAARGVPGVTEAWVRLERKAVGRAPGSAALRPVTGQGPQPSDRADRPLAALDGAPLVLPADAPPTLTDALLRASDSDRGTTYIRADGRDDRQMYRELLSDAACLLPGLRANGLQPGDSVLLHCDDNRNFATGFWACVLGGFVPTPIGIAPTYRAENAVTRRIRNAWELLDRPPLLTDRHMADNVAELSRLWASSALIVLAAEDIRSDEPSADLYRPDPEHPVVHLLTSGSTGVPKCVRHNHRTVVTRAYVNAIANNFGPADVTLNFMPLDHVAGFVMHNLRDVILPCEHVNARTESFMADPLRWFTWIERYRVTNTSAPNFVITLVTKLADEIARGRWDLSSLRDITNGGEAIVSGTMHEFLRMLAPHGLRPDVMRPAWGMSEFCGGVVHSTMHRDDEAVGVVTIDEWAADGTLTFLPGPKPGHPTFTEVGVPAPGTSLRVVDGVDATQPEDQIGRLQVRGPTLMVGYHENPAATAAAMTADAWFDTGDLGFVHDDRLVLTGREKDVLVIRSANYPCHEIEAVVGDVAGVLPTFVAACGDFDAETGTDELVLFCVFASEDPHVRRDVIRDLTRRVGTEVGVAPSRVIPVASEAFPKTSAGKIERQRLLADYHAGAFDAEMSAAAISDPSAFGSDRMWSFDTVWTPAPAMPGQVPAGVWLVFDPGGFTDRVRDHAPAVVVAVHPGPTWTKRTDVEYWIDPADQRQYDELFAAVRRDHGDVGAIVHAWSTVATATATTEAASTDRLELSALSVHRVVKACGSAPPRMLVLTTGACPVDERDPIEPLHATVNGLVRTANAEYGSTVIRQLDLRSGEPDAVSHTVTELADTGDDDIVAYRSGVRLVTRIRPLPPHSGDPAHRIHRGGLYLLTGGLGQIGSRIGQLLLSRYSAKLVINGRSAPVGERAAQLARLEGLGDVTYLQADVANAPALRGGIAAAEQRFGRTLDGLVHLAGADISSNWHDLEAHLLANEEAAEFHRMYHAKIQGTLAVAQVLDDRPDALLIIASSVNGYFGGAGFGAYSSASSFVPAFVDQWRRQGRAAQCHAWSLWVDEVVGAPRRAAVERHGFRPIEVDRGARLFEAALSDPASHVLIGLDESKHGVTRYIDPAVVIDCGLIVTYSGGEAVERTVVRDAVATAVGADAAVLRAEPTGTREASHVSGTGPGGLQPPLGDLETMVTDVWQTTLRQEDIGLDDHFFDLGGDSLLAMRLIARLNVHFDHVVDVLDLYEKPTVRQLAELLGARSRTGNETNREG